MFPASGAQRRPADHTRALGSYHGQPSSVSLLVESNIVQVPFMAQTPALSKIEELLESIVDAIDNGDEISIPYESIRSSQTGAEPEPQDGNDRPLNAVKFPGRTTQEVKKFEALFRIIEMSHEALLTGNLITKRNIYYQNPDLFKSQNAVDDMVDNLAFTLRVGREDLNIVATAKGLVSGPVDLMLRDGSIHSCDSATDTGLLLPSVSLIEKINFRLVRWVLVIEKEATFRTLATSQYAKLSRAGHGLLLTAKGFPDLATRRFLSLLHTLRPELFLFALVDFDPYGVAIMRTYKYGSQRLDHEENATAPRLRWLGIQSDDIMSSVSADYQATCDSSQSEASQSDASQDPASQESLSHSVVGSQDERPFKRHRVTNRQEPSDSVLPLTERDRKKAVQMMREISGVGNMDDEEAHQMRELQRMVMLNIKAEIQAVDKYGDTADWLDAKLHMRASTSGSSGAGGLITATRPCSHEMTALHPLLGS
ncbi:Spo11/DNA topoisomerase VI subunit A [Corynascus novoguineensis]|uniref:DNA topoisomerase (ATP-hydrolyzing) n=1 Tax=Corynascus novoguineensis TaxID=1126955 RepID=A0AAN7CXN9_9PEZI|nr:Spo11/DNA topoisomerase VI subunit A [Corynascus novoguineensis]